MDEDLYLQMEKMKEWERNNYYKTTITRTSNSSDGTTIVYYNVPGCDIYKEKSSYAPKLPNFVKFRVAYKSKLIKRKTTLR